MAKAADQAARVTTEMENKLADMTHRETEHVAYGSRASPLQQAAARQLPLCPVSDRGRMAAQYVAEGHYETNGTAAKVGLQGLLPRKVCGGAG
jgi:hypothetical protein